MKNLLKIRNLLAAVLLVFSTQSFSGQLNSLEESLLFAWFDSPELRQDIADTYWADVKIQAKETQAQLPIEISHSAVMINLTYQRGLITYYTVISADAIDSIPSKAQVAQQMCNDPQVNLYLVTFNGHIVYVHFKEGVYEAHSSFSISAEDCGSGI
jgi:hypothetical protein